MIPSELKQELKRVPQQLFELGTHALTHALKLSCCSPRGGSSFEEELSILQAAHASEILMKACIANAAHPLLIFENFPSSQNVQEDWLRFEELSSDGRTISLRELPERLWATTGFEIDDKAAFQDFRGLRNSIQHFGVPPDCNAATQTVEFIFPRMDNLLDHFWGTCALENFDDEEVGRKAINFIRDEDVPWQEPTWL